MLERSTQPDGAQGIETQNHETAFGDQYPGRFSERLVWMQFELEDMRQNDHIHRVRVDWQRRCGSADQRIQAARRPAIDVDDRATQYPARAQEIRSPEIADLEAVIAEQVADRSVHEFDLRPEQVHSRRAPASIGKAPSATAPRHTTFGFLRKWRTRSSPRHYATRMGSPAPGHTRISFLFLTEPLPLHSMYECRHSPDRAHDARNRHARLRGVHHSNALDMPRQRSWARGWAPSALLSISAVLAGCTTQPHVPDPRPGTHSGVTVHGTAWNESGQPAAHDTVRRERSHRPTVETRPPVPIDSAVVGMPEGDPTGISADVQSGRSRSGRGATRGHVSATG